jgi:N-methylhydantoinase A
MEATSRAALRREGFAAAQQRHVQTVAARYKGQSFELEIKWKPGAALTSIFHRAHLARYGYAQEANIVEIVSARLRSIGIVEKLKKERLGHGTTGNKIVTPHGRAPVHFNDGRVRAALYIREELPVGARLCSPCIVTEYSSTTLIPSSARAGIDQQGNLIIQP